MANIEDKKSLFENALRDVRIDNVYKKNTILGDHTRNNHFKHNSNKTMDSDRACVNDCTRDFNRQNLGNRSSNSFRNVCLVSVFFAFGFGLLLGIFLPINHNTKEEKSLKKLDDTFGSLRNETDLNEYEAKLVPYLSRILNSKVERSENSRYINRPRIFPRVTFVDELEGQKISDDFERLLDDRNRTDLVQGNDTVENEVNDGVIEDNIYWGSKVEGALPVGFDPSTNDRWLSYLKTSTGVKLEAGCGRMQNRLLKFADGKKACVRYRQNTDQIQGELFSFFLAEALGLPNLAPSAATLVNLTDPMWRGVAADIGSAQWNSNRPVVLTRYISNLESAHIPNEFKPSDRHLNKNDVFKMLRDKGGEDLTNKFTELAQWSDLIIFDYLTANLDRMVNNLYNYQWNANIMEAPAHNLARRVDSGLLVFLDNESGLLHGYRLLAKYEVYHSALLANLCVFRRRTADSVRSLHRSGAAAGRLNAMWRAAAPTPSLLDALPPLPPRTARLLQERLARLVVHMDACKSRFTQR